MSHETETHSADEPPAVSLPGLDLDFFRRVYRTTLLILALLTAIVWGELGPASALGLLLGAGVSLGALALLEWSVRRHLRSGTKSAAALMGVSIGKLFGITAVLVLAMFAAQRGWISLLWVLPGVALPHTVVVLKLIGRKLTELNQEEAGTGATSSKKR